MLFPKITKFSKNFSRKKAQIKENSRPLFCFSSVGLMSENSSFLVQQQLSAFLRVLRKNLKKRAKI
jgi:ribosomal protein L16/L10AE